MTRIAVATCQFPVSPEPAENERWIRRQTRIAAERGARVAHFPEGAMSGYAGADLTGFEGYDWQALRRATEGVLELARELGIWVVFGSAHPLSNGTKPHNCVYVVDDKGRLVERYDKRFCSGDAAGAIGDLSHYTPGDHPSVWDVDGVRCGALICYDYRFPELYREYRRLGVDVVFHSFHAGNASAERVEAIGSAIGHELASANPAPTFTYPGITMPASMTAAAAANHVWISCSNSSARESLWPAFFVRADGVTAGRLRRNIPGVLLTIVDTDAALYDSTVVWRENALNGVLHSGTLVSDPRSIDRTTL